MLIVVKGTGARISVYDE